MSEALIAPCRGRTEAYRRFVLEAPMDIALLDLDGRIVAASRHFLTHTGLDDVSGRKLADIFPETGDSLAAIRSRLENGDEFHAVTGRVVVNGRSRWVRVQASYWRDDDGQPCGYMILNRDVTAQYQAEQRRQSAAELLQAVVDNLPSGIVAQDFNTGEYLLVNRQAEQITGIPAHELIGRKIPDVFPGTLSAFFEMRKDSAIADGGTTVNELAINDYILRVRTLIYEDAQQRKRVLTIGEDISDLRSTTQALQEALSAAQAANIAKSEFLANISHEIRTPLNGVLGMAQAMAVAELPAEQHARLGVIRQCGEQLLGLLNDLLDMAKIEAGKMEIESVEFDLSDLVRANAATFRALAERKHLAFDLHTEDIDGVWRGDPTRLRQVLSNLLSNAVKFTERGRIEVDIRRDGDMIRFHVADTGIGMAPSTMARLFEKFRQADPSTTRRFGGTGLGLAISHDLVQLMGGWIKTESTEGSGSAFTFALPLQRVAKPLAKSGPATSRTRLRDLRVLCAEDNLLNQKVLKALLEATQIDLVIVENGALAVDAWSGGSWDLILMDVQMPVLDGKAAIEIIRAREIEEARPRTPIIALTANSMTHQIDEYLKCGADGVVAKPIKIDLLLGEIDRLTAADGADAVPEQHAAKR